MLKCPSVKNHWTEQVRTRCLDYENHWAYAKPLKLLCLLHTRGRAGNQLRQLSIQAYHSFCKECFRRWNFYHTSRRWLQHQNTAGWVPGRPDLLRFVTAVWSTFSWRKTLKWDWITQDSASPCILKIYLFVKGTLGSCILTFFLLSFQNGSWHLCTQRQYCCAGTVIPGMFLMEVSSWTHCCVFSCV